MAHFGISLTPRGPLIWVHVGVTLPRMQALTAAGQMVPSSQVVEMLVDTGASHTNVDQKVVNALGLTAKGSMPVLTPSTGAVPVPMPTYDVSMFFPGGSGAPHNLPVQSVTACDFSAQGISGLIGRDILSVAHLTYSGPNNLFLLSF